MKLIGVTELFTLSQMLIFTIEILDNDIVSTVSPKFPHGNVLLFVEITEFIEPVTVPLPVILAV